METDHVGVLPRAETTSLGTHTGVTSTLVVNNSIVTSFCNGNGE